MWLSEVDINHEHIQYMIKHYKTTPSTIHLSQRDLPYNMPEGYVLVDMLGPVVEDMFTSGCTKPIYLWFESIFAIPEELAGGLILVNKDYDYGVTT